MVARGKWIVELEKLRQCNKCSSYFLDQTNYEKNKEFHGNENKVEISNDEAFFASEQPKVKEEEKENSDKILRSRMGSKAYVILEQNSVKKYKCAKC